MWLTETCHATHRTIPRCLYPRPFIYSSLFSLLTVTVVSNLVKMDMPVNVPVDDPNADTEWLVNAETTPLQ